MKALLAMFGVLLLLSIGMVNWLVKKTAEKRMARQWEERELLLDRHSPTPTTRDILRRRAKSR